MESKSKKSNLWPIVVIWIGVFFGCQSSTFVRWSNAPSLVLAAYRNVIVTLLLLPVVLLKYREELRQMKLRQFLWCGLSGTMLGVHLATYFYSLTLTTIAASQVLCGMEVVYVAIFMLIFAHERLNRPAILGIVLALVGGVLVAYTGRDSIGNASLSGNLIALGSGFLLAMYSLVGRKVRSNCSGTLYNFLVFGAAAIVLSLAVVFSDYSCFGYDPINWATAFGMAICCSLLGHGLFNWSLKYLSPTFVAMVKSFSPVLATIWGVILFREIPLWNQILGGFVVITGIIIYSLKKEQ